MNINVNDLYTIRKNVFDSIQNSSTVKKIMIKLPWTPVPITGQTFAVLTAGLILGKKYGALSQILYILVGILFIPWFGGMTGGIDIVLGSDIGYFIGFVLTSYFIGSITEKYAKSRKFIRSVLVIGIGNFALIYIPGLAGLALWAYITQGTILSIADLLMMGFIPFIFGGIVKVIGASAVSKVFLPKE